MNIPCPNKSICVDDANALGNYSSEEPDRNLFRSTHYPNAIWEDDPDIWMACLGLCVSEISQADADLCAHNNAKICEGQKLFGNAEHACRRVCPDGLEYSMTVPANTFYADSQAQANALAVEWCNDYLNQLCAHIADPTLPAPIYRFPVPRPGEVCNDAIAIDTVCVDGARGTIIPACFVVGANKAAANVQARSVGEQLITNNLGCLVAFPKSFCINEGISQFIVPDRTGLFYPPLSWEVFGSVSPGVTFEPMGIAMKVSGSFTESGLFVFRLTLTDSRGTYTYRTYRVEVMEIDEPDVLPNAQQDEAYSHAISVQHGWDPKTFLVKAGDLLPTGLSLDAETGIISGTPTTFGTYTFTIAVVDKYNARCEKEFTLTIDPNIFATIPWALNTFDVPPGYSFATGAGESLQLGGVTVVSMIVNGGVGSASAALWVCNNTTGRVLNCNLKIVVTLGCDQQVGTGYGLTYTGPGPGITYASGTTLPAGEHNWPFVIPMGISNWSLIFAIGGGVLAPAPYRFGVNQWLVTLDIIP